MLKTAQTILCILALLCACCEKNKAAAPTPAPANTKEAYIDLGSGSTKLIIVSRSSDGKPPVVSATRTAILFKKNMKDGIFPEDIEKKGLETLKDYAEKARKEGAALKWVAATSVFREAKPAYVAQLFERWSNETGWKLKVISAEEEARAGYCAIVVADPSLQNTGFVGFDMGGGSIQLVQEKKGQFSLYSSLWGAVPSSKFLKETFKDKRMECADTVLALRGEIMKSQGTKDWEGMGAKAPIVAIGGVVYGFSKILGTKTLTEKQLLDLEKEFRQMDAAAIESKYPSTKPYGAEMWANCIALLTWMDILKSKEWKVFQIEMGAGISGLPFAQEQKKAS